MYQIWTSTVVPHFFHTFLFHVKPYEVLLPQTSMVEFKPQRYLYIYNNNNKLSMGTLTFFTEAREARGNYALALAALNTEVHTPAHPNELDYIAPSALRA